MSILWWVVTFMKTNMSINQLREITEQKEAKTIVSKYKGSQPPTPTSKLTRIQDTHRRQCKDRGGNKG